MNLRVRRGAVLTTAALLASLLPQTVIPAPIFISKAVAVDPTCVPTSDTATVSGFTILTFNSIGTCTWTAPNGITTLDSLLVVGGGGGGAGAYSLANTEGAGGGGGGGAYLASSVSIPSSVTIRVGGGGAGGGFSASRSGNNGARGSSSAFGTITAGGGGGGGCEVNTLDLGVTCTTASMSGETATAAGSGGGASNYFNAYNPGGAGTGTNATFNLNVFNSQVGYRGGYYNQGGSSSVSAGAPGGGARGAANFNTRGAALNSNITGIAVDYGRGGGAFGVTGWTFTSSTPGYGTGGDGQRGSSAAGATGAQGVVIVKYKNISSMTTSVAAGSFNYRTAKAITATPSTNGRLTFRANNKIIPNCKNLVAVMNVARTCSFRANNRGNVNLTVTLVPTDGTMSTITSLIGSIFVNPRSGTRT